MAMLLQSLCCRLGIATGLNLAGACWRWLPVRWRLPLWLLAEVAIVACDLACAGGGDQESVLMARDTKITNTTSITMECSITRNRDV